MGNLNSTTGNTVTFTAGNNDGSVALFVNATLNGKTVQSSPVVIAIKASSLSPKTGFLGLPGNEGYLVIGICLAVAIAVMVGYGIGRKGEAGPVEQEDRFAAYKTASASKPAGTAASSEDGPDSLGDMF
jgi:hypothetical protein